MNSPLSPEEDDFQSEYDFSQGIHGKHHHAYKDFIDAAVKKIEAEWSREIVERVAAYRRGELELIDAETVFAEMRQIAQ
jgi:DNA-binding transcriptional regulator GbsR (MarR family)